MSLSQKHCVPCEGGTNPLTPAQIDMYRDSVSNWTINPKQITRNFTLTDFKSALAFVNRIGELADSEGHHPDILLHDYKQVTITLSTHAVGGLSENDFIVAVKIDEISQQMRSE